MITEADIHIPLKKAGIPQQVRKAIAQKLGVSPSRIEDYRLLKESIDARRRPICKQLRYLVGVDESLPEEQMPTIDYPTVPECAKRVIVVGSGPAGLFASLRCLKLGVKPVMLERGKCVKERHFDLSPINLQGVVNHESNYCFGEGGAGTFSDGKLYTRSTKRGPVQEVYERFVAHGAPKNILTDAHPHIGSNKLPRLVESMRDSIRAAGGEVHFGTKVTGIVRSLDQSRIVGVSCANGEEYLGDAVILATGHSARDIYRMLHAEGLLLERKSFAVGVRIEHPQELIDAAQYHLRAGEQRPEGLSAARYTLASKIEGRGVHSFCMCPGGHIVPAATENDEVVVNGMSLSRRNSPFANSGFVVSVEPEDTDIYEEEHGVLSGIAYQKALEIASSQAGGGQQKAPAQRVQDFMSGRVSGDLPATTYKPGLTSCDLNAILPKMVSERMRAGLELFNKKLRGFAGEEALLIGCETRTSSPVRIPRELFTLEHPELKGLYPCAEGAGYAGGIVSAALDGLRCADAAVAAIRG